MHTTLLVALTLLLLALSYSGHAEEPYYIWVDEDGITNYSQRNPRNVDATFVSRSQAFGTKKAPTQRGSPPGQVPASESKAETTPTQDLELDKEVTAVQEEIARIRASNCSLGKRNLAKLQAYGRLRIRDPDGGERVLTDNEKQQRIESAQKTIKDNCGAA